jgi:HAE1 family hydrophobic/amphiphilic exporter-1/multidrug efflux pump
MPVGALVGEFYGKTAHLKDGLAIAFPPPAIFGLGTAGGFEFYLQSRGENDPKRLNEVAQQFIATAAKSPKIAMVNTFWRANVPQLYVDVDRETAKSLGVPLDEVFNTLAATLGAYYVNDFNKYGRTWQVLLSAEPGQRGQPHDAGAVYVRSEKGAMVPIRSLARIEYTNGPGTMERFNNLPAVKMLGGGAPGVSSGDAIAEIERIAAEVLPADFSLDWSGASFQEKRSGGTSVVVLALGALMAFLILAAQYEKWSLPLSVMLALPFGTFGALAAVWLRGLTNDVYFQIGCRTSTSAPASRCTGNTGRRRSWRDVCRVAWRPRGSRRAPSSSWRCWPTPGSRSTPAGSAWPPSRSGAGRVTASCPPEATAPRSP